jgi:hypothetical protein
VVDVPAVVDVEHLYGASSLVDSVDDAIGSASRAMTTSQGSEEWLANAAWTQGQGSVTELDNSGRYGFRQPFCDGAAGGGLEPYLVTLAGHVPL